MEFIRRLDRNWARGECALIVVILGAMLLLTGYTALIRNLTRWDVGWAAELLMDSSWTDTFLRKGTLWLAFLGASLATHHHKHVRIDLLPRMLPLAARYGVHAAAGIVAGLVMFALAFSLGSFVYLNLNELLLDYGVPSGDGVKHVCDLGEAEWNALPDLDVSRAFCALRAALGALGIPAESPVALSKVILPLSFVVIGLRFLGSGIGAAIAAARGPEAMQRLEDAEQARMAAARAELDGDAPLDGARP
jgi:TRAP-type C4-dicarboxylate transport system permease small subunit